MEAFGDESGSVDHLLSGEHPHFSLAIVAGPIEECVGCARRAVRLQKDLDEARWSEMKETEKRRFADCISERSDGLEIAFLNITPDDVRRIPQNYKLYQNTIPEIHRNLFVTGIGYCALISEISSHTPIKQFTFDRIYSRNQSDKVADMVLSQTHLEDVRHGSSHQYSGIQTADCVAGLLAERGVADTGENIPEVIDCTNYALSRIEKALVDM